MKYCAIVLTVILLSANLYAETYTGRAENVETNDRGLAFTVVVEDSRRVEVLRRDQWISAGVFPPEEIKDEVKRVVKRMTQDTWAHIEGGKQALRDKTEIENYRVDVSSYVPPADRGSIAAEVVFP